jgi:hypothetical protein
MGHSREEFLKLRESEQAETSSARAEEFVEAMEELHTQVKQRLQKSNQEYKRRAIRGKDSFSLKLGTWFWRT